MPASIHIPGDWKLDEQEREIALNEAAGWNLTDYGPENIDDPKDNTANFEKLPIGDRPKRIRLRLKSDPAPANCDKLFDCKPFVELVATDVTAYREK